MTADAMALKRIDHVRFFVGNARQSAYFYRNAFGFDVVAYAGLETGVRHEAGYVLRQGDITFVLASPLRPDHPDAQRLVQHGDGVQDIALEVDDVPAAFEAAVGAGRKPAVPPPHALEDEHGVYEFADDPRLRRHDAHASSTAIAYRGVFAPGFQPLDPDRYSPATFHPVGLQGDRPHRRQRRRRQDGRLGRVLQQGAGLLASSSASTTRTSAPSTRP